MWMCVGGGGSMGRPLQVALAFFVGRSRVGLLRDPSTHVHASSTFPCRVMHDELRVAGSSNQLASVIAAEVCAALTLLARKAEVMAATGPDVRNVPERAAAHPAQLRNIALCSSLQDVHRWVGRAWGGGGV